MPVIATAGHVDHGKSTLVRALTGTDPDRFAEEKARGLTIDLGFASLTLASGRQLSFVDVPGHVRFIKNMLAGVGSVGGCLFVVAATEGWMPQSEEHLRILEVLGLGHGLTALTMAGRVGTGQLASRRREVEERLAGTFLSGAPVVAVDAVTGQGMEALYAGLDRLAGRLEGSTDPGGDRARLWVDRSFVVQGAGTVVTGTLTGGWLRAGDRLALVPGPSPDHRPVPVRVRSLQVHGRTADQAAPGQRVAVNLVGVGADAAHRGQALVDPQRWHVTGQVDVALSVLASLAHEVDRHGDYHLHVGSAEQVVRLRPPGGPLQPGQRGWVRLHLTTPLPLLPGDRYVLRDLGRSETVGGGEVLDVAPVRPLRRARPDRTVDRVVAERKWTEAAELERLTGVRRTPTVGRWVVDPAALAAGRRELRRRVEAAGAHGLDPAGLNDRERALLDSLDGVVILAGRAHLAHHTALSAAAERFLARCRRSPFEPPDPVADGLPPEDLRALVRRGHLVECGGIWFAVEALDQAAAAIATLLADHRDGVSVSDVRRALGTTRRFTLPLLAHLDATGITRRRGDHRLAGPRLDARGMVGSR